ncbi:hypothetical protein ACWEOI_33485 [Nocardia sp. NPDC004340]
MLIEIATTAVVFIFFTGYVARSIGSSLSRRRLSNPHSVAAIRARLEGEKRIVAASKREAVRLSTELASAGRDANERFTLAQV